MARYQGWTGERKQKCKRGFATKREAAQWEQQFILQKKASMDMELESFCKLCEEDVRPRLKKSTWLTKENIIKSKILPYLGRAYGKGGSAYSARTAHPFQRNGAPFRFKLSKTQQVD